MKTFEIKIIKESETEEIEKLLENLKLKGSIEFKKTDGSEEPTPASEEQVQEIIDEAELAPYYSEKEAKDILNL